MKTIYELQQEAKSKALAWASVKADLEIERANERRFFKPISRAAEAADKLIDYRNALLDNIQYLSDKEDKLNYEYGQLIKAIENYSSEAE